MRIQRASADGQRENNGQGRERPSITRHGQQARRTPALSEETPRNVMSPIAASELRLDDHRNDHGPTPVLRVDPATDGATDDLAERVRVSRAVLRGIGEGANDERLDRVEHRLVLCETAGLDLRADDDTAGLRIDGGEDRDEALFRQDPAVFEVCIRDLAHGRAVDVDVPEVELADDGRDAVLEVDD